MRVASTMPANDASKAVCGAGECSLENTAEYSVQKETEKGRRGDRAFKSMKIAAKVNDKLNASDGIENEYSEVFQRTNSKRRGNEIETGKHSSVQAADSNLFSNICISCIVFDVVYN